MAGERLGNRRRSIDSAVATRRALPAGIGQAVSTPASSSGWYLKSYLQAIRACRARRHPGARSGRFAPEGRRSAGSVSLAKHIPYRWFLHQIDAHLVRGAGQSRLSAVTTVCGRNGCSLRPTLWTTTGLPRRPRWPGGTVKRAAWRRAWGARETTTVFVFAGKFMARKRATDVIDAIGALAAAGTDVRGVARRFGSGRGRDARPRGFMFGGPIAFEGFQNQTHLAARYAAANVLVMPSEWRDLGSCRERSDGDRPAGHRERRRGLRARLDRRGLHGIHVSGWAMSRS